MIFHDASRYCYDWLKAQSFVKEESLTDWLLYYISNHNRNVYYKAFTRNEEASNGSDWEWWILTDEFSTTKAYRLLVQAKKLKPNSNDNYPLVTYSNKNGFQIDLLIAEARTRNALPLYAYYSCCLPNIDEQCKNINYISDAMLKWCENCVNGCFLTSAFALHKNVFSNPRRKIVDQELIDASFGLSLLDFIWGEPGKASSLLSEFNNHFKDLNNDKNNWSGIQHNYKDLPVYVKTLIERREEDLSWLDREFHHEIGILSGVVIVDNRKRIFDQ